MMALFVFAGVAAWRPRITYSFDAIYVVAYGILFISGLVSILYLRSPSVNIFINLGIWRDYRGLLILFFK